MIYFGGTAPTHLVMQKSTEVDIPCACVARWGKDYVEVDATKFKAGGYVGAQ